MGNNNCCGSRNDDKEGPFTEQEKRHLQALFDELTGPKRTAGKNKFNKLTLNTLFPENPEIALLVYNLILHISKTENKINYDNFELAMEVLLKEPRECRLKDFREKEKIDVLALASVDSFKLSREELRALPITYIQALDFVKILLKIFHYESPIVKRVDESVAKHIVDGAFHQDEGRITWWNFIHYLKENLIYINRALKSYFSGKFLNEKINLKLPELNKTSFLLNKDLLAILYLSNIYMQLTPSLEFVYSSRYKGLSYPQIAQALTNYQSSSYIFLKVEPYVEDESPNNLGSNYIIGGFSRLPWKDSGEYSGDNDCYLFSLTPQFQNMYALTKNSAHPNYTYLKSGFGYNQGIGFGGGKNEDFRIWINGQDINKSYVKNEDKTFAEGALLGPGLEKMRIVEVEIWGLGIDYHNKQYLDTLLNASTVNRMSTGEAGRISLSSNLAPYGTAENIALNKETQNVAYNQSKIADLIHESDQLSKSLTLFESKLAQNNSRNNEQNEQENVKRNSRPSPVYEREGSYKESRFAEDEMISSQSSSSTKKMTYTELYGYHNPFKGDDQNVTIARSFTNQDLQVSPKKA